MARVFNRGRTIEHAKGKSQIPISPQRVVVMDTATLDGALVPDIKPLGTNDIGFTRNSLQAANCHCLVNL
ncbi:MAG: hypothetical protein AAF579_16560 [Cyanobacteria bacterium P01_C01_bin.118]